MTYKLAEPSNVLSINKNQNISKEMLGFEKFLSKFAIVEETRFPQPQPNKTLLY